MLNILILNVSIYSSPSNASNAGNHDNGVRLFPLV